MEKQRPGVGVGVMIFKNGRLLLGQRNPNRIKAGSALSGHGQWTMPGGKQDLHESYEDAAAREVLEETGLMINPNWLKIIALNNDMTETAHFTTIGLLYEGEVGEPQVTEPDVIVQWDWFSLGELPQPLYLPSKNVLRNYERKLLYIR